MSCRRFEYLAEVDGEGFLGCLLEIAYERVADIAIPERVNVQSDDAVDVDMITKLGNQLNELDVLLVGLRSEHGLI